MPSIKEKVTSIYIKGYKIFNTKLLQVRLLYTTKSSKTLVATKAYINLTIRSIYNI